MLEYLPCLDQTPRMDAKTGSTPTYMVSTSHYGLSSLFQSPDSSKWQLGADGGRRYTVFGFWWLNAKRGRESGGRDSEPVAAKLDHQRVPPPETSSTAPRRKKRRYNQCVIQTAHGSFNTTTVPSVHDGCWRERYHFLTITAADRVVGKWEEKLTKAVGELTEVSHGMNPR